MNGSHHVPESLPREASDSLFGTGLDNMPEIPRDPTHIPSNGDIEGPCSSESFVSDEYRTNCFTEPPSLLSSSSPSNIKPVEAVFVDLRGISERWIISRRRNWHYLLFRQSQTKGMGMGNRCKTTLSKARKSLKSAFGSDYIHLELLI